MKFVRKSRSRQKRIRQPLRCKVRAWTQVIPNQKAMKEMTREANVLWEQSGGDRVSAKSFWIGSEDQPKCAIEEFAKACARFHCPGFLGAEYWVQIRTGVEGEVGEDGGLEFHFDKDEKLLVDEDVWKHPALSTVTYLQADTNNSMSTWGAPLVIFDSSSSDPSDPTHYGSLMRPSRRRAPAYSPSRAWACFPAPGHHVAFSGDLLHGIPAELIPLLRTDKKSSNASRQYCRISLPVNIWYTRPKAAQRLPDELICRMLRDKLRHFRISSDLFRSPCRATFVDVHTEDLTAAADNDDLHLLSEHVDGDTAPLPVTVLRKVEQQMSHSHSIACASTSSSKSEDKNCLAGVSINYVT